MRNLNTFAKIFLNILFCATLLWFFSRNCFLRPYAGGIWKEVFSGVLMLASIYANYFLLYPQLMEKRHSHTLYWLAVVVMVLIITVLELAIAHNYIMECTGFVIEQVGFYSFFSKLLFAVGGRNLFFNFFSYLFRERKQLQDALDNEVKIVYQDVRRLDVKDHDNKLVLIPIEDIYYCRQDGNYTYIYSVDNIRYTRLGSMVNLKQLFGKEDFVRISPTLLIPYKYIWSCNGGEVEMKKMPWTPNPLTFTIDTKNNDEISERITCYLKTAKTDDGRDAPWHASTDDGQRNNEDVARNVSTTNRKRRKPIMPPPDKIEAVYAYIQAHLDCNTADIIAQTGYSQSTVERCLAELRKQERVEYMGAKKNGGYQAV